MNKILFITLVAIMIFVSTACSSSEIADTTNETAGETAEVVEEDYDDFQAGIPQEYRLRRNITADLDEPLPPSPEGAPEASFFSLLTKQSGANADIGTLFVNEELENFFGMKLNEDACSEIKTGSGGVIMRFGFIPAEGEDSPELGVMISPFATEAEAEEAYDDWGGKEIEGGPGKKSRIMDMFGLTMITVLTDDHAVFSISGYMFENQEDLLLAYIEDLLGRYAGLSGQ